MDAFYWTDGWEGGKRACNIAEINLSKLYMAWSPFEFMSIGRCVKQLRAWLEKYIYVLNNHNISVIWIQWYNSNLSCAGWWSKSYSAVLQRSFCKSDELREAIGPCSLNRSIGSNRNGPYTARVPLSGCVRGCTLPSALVEVLVDN
jgi:hypothetical protein